MNKNDLAVENLKLRTALAGVIPWVGQCADGPVWATEEAKIRNKAMCEDALKAALDCFPEHFDSRELLTSPPAAP